MRRNCSNPFIEQLSRFEEMIARGAPDHRDIVECLERRAEAFENLVCRFAIEGYGLTAYNAALDQWMSILEDASHPGSVRYQCFGRHGFVGHGTYATDAEVLAEMVTNGFTQVETRDLTNVFTSDLWAEGSKRCDLMQQLNRGQITFAQYAAKAA